MVQSHEATQGMCELTHRALLRVTGPDAEAFLQGQLTQDVTALRPGEWKLAGYCSAKGRLLATFMMSRPAAEEFLLACSHDLVQATARRLSMFVLRAKCHVVVADALSLVGLVDLDAGDANPSGLPAGSEVQAQPAATSTARWARVVAKPVTNFPTHDPSAMPDACSLPDTTPTQPLAHWRWMEVNSGMPWVEAATADQFVPQMINLELQGGVSFRKGCYPGQEVVARSQYRGTLKRRMFLFDLPSAAHAGDEVFEAGDPEQPAGMVVQAASLEGQHRALVSLKIAALEQGHLYLGKADGPRLSLRSLPYAVPLAAEDH